MKSALLKIILALSALRLIPHILVAFFSKARPTIEADLARWSSVYFSNAKAHPPIVLLIIFLTRYREFRNLFYHRTGLAGRIFAPLCPQMSTLFIATPTIGPGFFIQHGFATIIAAQSIGKNFWVNQQVTIGYSKLGKRPIIGDDVTINAGAKVIGGVHVGNDSIIGANAVVVKDLPAGATAVGVPARVIKIRSQPREATEQKNKLNMRERQ